MGSESAQEEDMECVLCLCGERKKGKQATHRKWLFVFFRCSFFFVKTGFGLEHTIQIKNQESK